MPRAKLPRQIDSNCVVVERIANGRAAVANQLFNSDDIARTLAVDPLPIQVQDAIVELISIYRTTRRYTSTVGETLKLLAKLRRLLVRLTAGRPLRARDLKRRTAFLQRLVDPASGTFEHTFNVLLPNVVQLIAELQARRDFAVLALELDGIAERESALLRDWLDGERKVEGQIENKRHLCGWLRVVWETYSAHQLRHHQASRRNFVSAVLKAANIQHPDQNNYQTLDSWIETEVSAAPKPVSAPTVG